MARWRKHFKDEIRPPINYFGGKGHLYKWVLEHLTTDHELYAEPFGGAASVLLNKPRLPMECYNDADTDVAMLFQVLHLPDTFDEFMYRVVRLKTGHDQMESLHQWSMQPPVDAVDTALRLYIRHALGRGGSPDSYSDDLKRIKATSTRLGELHRIHRRLATVFVSSVDALGMIRSLDMPGNLLYLDPPYAGAGRGHYQHFVNHEALACTLHSLQHAKAIISNYWREPYLSLYADWRADTLVVNKQMSNAKTSETEALWWNWK